MSLDTYNTYGKNYGMGINFGDKISFTNKAFGLNIQSDVDALTNRKKRLVNKLDLK